MSLRKLTQVPVEAPRNGLQGACSLDPAVFNVFKVSKSYEFNTLKDDRQAFHACHGHRHCSASRGHRPIGKAEQPLLGKEYPIDSSATAAVGRKVRFHRD